MWPWDWERHQKMEWQKDAVKSHASKTTINLVTKGQKWTHFRLISDQNIHIVKMKCNSVFHLNRNHQYSSNCLSQQFVNHKKQSSEIRERWGFSRAVQWLQGHYPSGQMKTDGFDASRFCFIINACWRQPLCCLLTSCLSSMANEAACSLLGIHSCLLPRHTHASASIPYCPQQIFFVESQRQIPWYDLHYLPLSPAVWIVISSAIFQTREKDEGWGAQMGICREKECVDMFLQTSKSAALFLKGVCGRELIRFECRSARSSPNVFHQILCRTFTTSKTWFDPEKCCV